MLDWLFRFAPIPWIGALFWHARRRKILQQTYFHSFPSDDRGMKKCLGLLFDLFHGFVVMSRLVMKEHEPFDLGFSGDVNGHINGAVAPALARLGAGKILLWKILSVMDQQIRAASELDHFRVSAFLLFDVRGVNETFILVMNTVEHDAVQRMGGALASGHD